MALRLTPTGDSEDAQAAMAAAQLAQQTADNARQMVLSDRAKNASTIDELRAAAAQLPTTQQAATEVHAALQQQIDLLETNLNNVETTPGPQGEPGPAGKDGAAGPTGPVGQTGATGSAGVDGKSAYQLARDAGYGGTQAQWLASLKGADGATGSQGPQGATGPTGAQGAKGDTGATGTAGSAGAAGATGAAGTANFAVGIRPTPALALLATTDITVPLSRDMGGTSYNYQYAVTFDSTAVMQVTYKSRTSSSVTFTLKALVAVGAGYISVAAW